MGFKVIKENILKSNDDVAKNVKDLMESCACLMINIISSPGAGKTAFLEKIGPMLAEKSINTQTLTGDCFTSNDAERIDAAGVRVVQINTGNACHIDAGLVKKALEECVLDGLDLVIVENVGNLVCPAEFDIGEDIKIGFFSTTEGCDKPVKYPLLVQECGLVILNKKDLLPHVDFDVSEFKRGVRHINPGIKVMEVSSRTGEGLEEFVEWIIEKIKTKKEKRQ